MSLMSPMASGDRSACSTMEPSGSWRSSFCVDMATTSSRPSGNQPNPEGSSQSTTATVSALPSRSVRITRWACMSENHRAPLRHRGPSEKLSPSKIVRIWCLLIALYADEMAQ